MTRIFFALALAALPAVALAKQPAPEMSGHKEKQMKNCPSAVTGAVTTIENRKDGVLLTIVGNDDATAKEIQKRAHEQENISAQPARGAIEHTGEGTGSGQFGYCPGMQQGTMVSVQELPNGAAVTVRSRASNQVQTLQQSTRARLKNLRATR